MREIEDELFNRSDECSEITNAEIDLSVYDDECLKTDVMVVEIRGVRLPIWRAIESLLYVKDQDTDEIVPFKLRWAQKLLYVSLLNQGLKDLPMRQDILKSRQLGFSTEIAGIIFLVAAFRANTKCVVMADIKEHASTIFDIYRTFYEHLDDSNPDYEEIRKYEEETGKQSPESIKPALEKSRDGLLMKFSNKSSIQVIVAGESSGRSMSCTIIHSSETAFQKDLQKTNRSLFKTVSINNRKSMIFMETTANGYNDYKKVWDRDVLGKGVFHALFVPWYQNPDYKKELPNGVLPQLEAWIYQKWKQHPEITKEQIMWYWLRYTEDGDRDGMLQEYPWDANDAFISSGKSSFNTDKIKRRLDELIGKPVVRAYFKCKSTTSPDGQTVTISDSELVYDNSGDFAIYYPPEKGRHYVVICDPTKGLNHDFSAIQVLEQNTGVQVAKFKAKVSLGELAIDLYCIGRHYNFAHLSVENNTGTYVNDRLIAMGYPNLHIEQAIMAENINENVTMRYGHATTRATRDLMIAQFVEAFNENPRIINDIETLQEMETFQAVPQKNGGFKLMANSASATDDLVMAYAPFWIVRSQQAFDFDNTTKEPTKRTFRDPDGFMAYEMELRRREKEKSSVKNSIGITW